MLIILYYIIYYTTPYYCIYLVLYKYMYWSIYVVGSLMNKKPRLLEERLLGNWSWFTGTHGHWAGSGSTMAVTLFVRALGGYLVQFEWLLWLIYIIDIILYIYKVYIYIYMMLYIISNILLSIYIYCIHGRTIVNICENDLRVGK